MISKNDSKVIKAHHGYQNSKRKPKSNLRSHTVHILEEISILIKNKKYTEALETYKETSYRTDDLNRIGLFLELHLINNIITDEKEINLIESLKRNKKNIFSELIAQKWNYKKNINTRKVPTADKFLFEHSSAPQTKVDFLLRKTDALKEIFFQFSDIDKCKYVLQIIELTEEKIFLFLKKKFDLEVFKFLNIYVIKRKTLFTDFEKEKYDFLTDKDYYKSLCFYDLMAIYEFTDHFKVFVLALTLNPHMEKKKVTCEFKRHMPDEMDDETKQAVVKISEAVYINYLYNRSEKEGFKNSIMVRKKNRTTNQIPCAIPSSYVDNK